MWTQVSPTSLDLCEIACEPIPSIAEIQETLPEPDLDSDNSDLDSDNSDADNSDSDNLDLDSSDLDSEPDLECPAWNEDPGGELGPIEGYESCQVHFGNYIAVVESDGSDGDNGDNGGISFDNSATDALPAHLGSPEAKFQCVSNTATTIHVPRASIPTVPQAQSALADLVKLLRPPRTSG